MSRGDGYIRLYGTERSGHIFLEEKLIKLTIGENDMSNLRRVVTVQLMDDDQGLPVDYALVAEFKGIVTEDNDPTTIQEVIMDQDISSILERHNKKRSEIINTEIQTRTGQSVKLNPVKLKNLRWVVR